MGYARSGKTLVDAVERGIKYGLKTGELVKNADKTIGAPHTQEQVIADYIEFFDGEETGIILNLMCCTACVMK